MPVKYIVFLQSIFATQDFIKGSYLIGENLKTISYCFRTEFLIAYLFCEIDIVCF